MAGDGTAAVTDLRDLIQDLLAHAPEAPAVCAALMRRAARELEISTEQPPSSGKHQRPRCEKCRGTGQISTRNDREHMTVVKSCECQREAAPCR